MAKKLNRITVNKHNSDTVLIENIYKTDGEYWKFDMPASDADVYSTFVDEDKIHSISICSEITHGRLEVNALSAAEKSVITVTTHPYDGFVTV